MKVRPVARKGIYEDIVLQIRAMIDRGELKPGDRLLSERSLAEMFFVSRNTVREAIKALSENGLLESRQGAGTFVTEVDGDTFANTFAKVILRGQPEVRDVFEVRKLLEPEIAALAARNATPVDVALFEEVLAEQEAAVGVGRSGRNCDQQFHELLADASGNTVLREMIGALHDHLAESRSRGLQSLERQKASLVAHRAIVEAVRNGHVMQAEKAMRDHLDEIESIVFSGNI
jgi:GntR family transcriptional repressor for pyruvate dehydrogenase complex